MSASDELELVKRCARGDAQALARLEADYLAPTTAALSRRFGADCAQETTQRLRHQLLVPPKGARAGILEFQGKGALKGWLRVVASRLALEVLQSGRVPAAVDEAHALTQRDGELQSLTQRYGPLLRDAFTAALASLDKRQRLALKLHTLDGLPLEKIAAIFHVNASSVSRWLSDARTTLREQTLALLQDRLSLSPASARRLLGQLDGQWDASLRRVL